MKKKTFITVLSISTCIALAGCSDNQVQSITLDEVVNQTIAESETPNNLVDHINMELCENVNVDADVAVPNNFSGSVNKYKAYVEPFVRGDVLKMFGVSEQDVEQLSDNLYRNENTFFEFSNEISDSLSIKTENAGCYYMYNSDYTESCSIIENFGEDQELDFQSSGMVKEYEDTYVAEDDSVYNGGKIQVIYSQDGIQRLDVPNQYRVMEQERLAVLPTWHLLMQ